MWGAELDVPADWVGEHRNIGYAVCSAHFLGMFPLIARVFSRGFHFQQL
jgi:hypothetical protein